MIRFRIFRKGNQRLIFQSWMSVCLLFLYITGTIGTDFVHEIVHSHVNVELHSALNEKDPCHKAIYHHEKDNGCNHTTHLIKVEKCMHCHILFHATDQVTLSASPSKLAFHDFVALTNFIPVTLSGNTLQQSLRGPPAV